MMMSLNRIELNASKAQGPDGHNADGDVSSRAPDLLLGHPTPAALGPPLSRAQIRRGRRWALGTRAARDSALGDWGRAERA